MSTMNRDQALLCIQKAKKCIKENKLAKAEKFLNKSLRMYETIEAKSLLASLQNPQSNTTQNTNTPTQPPPTASQSSPNLNRTSPANASTSSIGSQSSSRMSKDEEVQMIRQILRARDFYSILSVAKDADEKALKKAYRKKALKCHPDRNKAPGAEEAFKKLSKAYDCLRDKRKRQIYDQYGEDSPQLRNNGRSAQFQQMTPDDIIRMFFGGDFGGHRGGFHFHTGGHPQRRQRSGGNGQPMEGGPMVYLMQLLPIILVFFTMILPSLMMFGGNSNGSSNSSGGGLFGRSGGGYGHGSMENVYFTLDKTHPFTLEKKTDRLGTMYYIQPSRRGTWGYQRYKPPRLEQEVESAYLTRLIRRCEDMQQKELGRLEKIRSNKVNGEKRAKLLKRLMKHKRKLDKNENKQCVKLYNYIDQL